MTPEWTIFWSAVAGGVGAYFGSYLRQKGQNLATKEDIAGITRTQVAIKTELATRGHFSRLRYEREIEVYREVWRDVRKFYLESDSAFAWHGTPNENAVEFPSVASWQAAWRQMAKTIEDNKPFYPAEIWSELNEFETWARSLAMSYRDRDASSQQKKATADKAKFHYERVENAIRFRLAQFDDAN